MNRDELPSSIWLIDVGDEIVWCDTDRPSDEINLDDSERYVKARLMQEEIARASENEKYLEGLNYRLNEQIQQLQAENEALKAERHNHLACLSDISDMCIGQIAMGFDLDSHHIGELIYKTTGLTSPELAGEARRKPQDKE